MKLKPGCEYYEKMSDEEFEQAIQELNALIKRRRQALPANRDRIQREYETKLKELMGNTHMAAEDIRFYLD